MFIHDGAGNAVVRGVSIGAAAFESLVICSSLRHAAERLPWGAVNPSRGGIALSRFGSRNSRRDRGAVGSDRSASLHRHVELQTALGRAERPLRGGIVTGDDSAAGLHAVARDPRRPQRDEEFVLTLNGRAFGEDGLHFQNEAVVCGA